MRIRAKVCRTDPMEKKLRKHALDCGAVFTTLKHFDIHHNAYIRGLRDAGIDEKYIEIYKKVVKRVREAYKNEY